MFKTLRLKKLMLFAAIGVPIAVSAVSVAVAIPCNKIQLGTLTRCNASWAASTYCSYWPGSTCNSQTGAPNQPGLLAGNGCGSQSQNPANHCVTRTIHCLPKFFCLWRGSGCLPGTAMIDENLKQIYLDSNVGVSECCVPQS